LENFSLPKKWKGKNIVIVYPHESIYTRLRKAHSGENTFSKIDRTYQNYVLNLYQESLIKKEEHTSNEHYLALATEVSLKNLIVSNTVANDAIRDTFKKQVIEEDQHIILPHDDDFSFEIEILEENKDGKDGANNIIPLINNDHANDDNKDYIIISDIIINDDDSYANNNYNNVNNDANADNNDIVIIIDEGNDDEHLDENTTSKNNNNNVALENENALSVTAQRQLDRRVLTDLIDALETYAKEYKINPRIANGKRALSVIIPILTWLVYGGVEAWFIYEKILSDDLTNCKNPSNWGEHCDDANHPANSTNQLRTDLQVSIFGFVGGFGSCLTSLMLPHFWWKAEAPISQDECKEIIICLDKLIFDLNTLSDNQAPANHRVTVTQLETVRSELHDNQARLEISDIFTRLATITKKIRTDSNLGYYSSGITHFKPNMPDKRESKKITLLDDSYGSSSDSEQEPLLSNKPT
jgi:hypothetical protein